MITIVPMTAAHIQAIHAIECHSFSDPWSCNDILDEINQPRTICIAALHDKYVAGYAIMRHIVDEGHICNIAVHEDYRHKGIGSAMINSLITVATAREIVGITLEVRIGNRAAMALYHKYGFKVEGYRRDFYRDPTEDAVIMWKYI
ncbi:MAG: ribosomal protein S18-alanine N-acetyltransferase [Defluviitaleaceae bacterium]|nr:ribosomal protein S18-alanine N-acetyltransferase [Defluviitaleaceae bacterium]